MEKSSSGTTTLYWYMSPGIVAESDQSGNLKSEYVFFNGERVARRDNPAASGPVFYYFSDHLKTTDIVTDAQGNILNESDFYPWGGELQFLANDPNHYKFTGKERDSETGLDYFGARYYSNGLGRFITPDWSAHPERVPYADLSDPQSLNQYSYVRNVPTTRVDIDGHDGFWDDVFDAGTGFIRGAAASVSYGAVGAPQSGDSTMSLFGQGMGSAMIAHLGMQATVDGTGKVGIGLIAAPETEGASLSVSLEGALEAGAGTLISVGAAKNTGAVLSAMASKSGSNGGNTTHENTQENVDRMAQGKGPIGNDGKTVELHHDGQQANSPLKQMTRTDHRGKGNFAKNHPNTGQSKSNINRAQFAKQRQAHWKDQAQKAKTKE